MSVEGCFRKFYTVETQSVFHTTFLPLKLQGLCVKLKLQRVGWKLVSCYKRILAY
jgi:hypothetical protein